MIKSHSCFSRLGIRYRFAVVLLALGLLAGLSGCATTGGSATSGSVPEIVDAQLKAEMSAFLADLSEYVSTLDVGSGYLKIEKESPNSIFCNANLARILMASYRITGNKEHLNEALRWCDNIYRKQQSAITSTIEEGGFWPDYGTDGNIYFGDAGTASTTLAIGYQYADAKRQALYLNAMKRYARFVTRGCLVAPRGRGEKATTSWVIQEGDARGALGCGYHKGKLSLQPYTISTATTGAAFFSELYAITKNPEYQKVASGAVRWLLKIRKDDGEIPYTLDGKEQTRWPLDTLAYCTEAFVAADTYLNDPELKKLMRQELRPTVKWFIKLQNPDGSWGELRSPDQQRSPRAVTFLTWWYNNIEPCPKVAGAVQKYCRYLLDPEKSKAYGIKEIIRTTGFTGLAIAEVIAPGSTF